MPFTLGAEIDELDGEDPMRRGVEGEICHKRF